MKRDLFVFDLDGTLVDSFGHYFESLTTIFNELGTEKGVKFTDELRYPSLTEPLPKFLSDSLGENQGAAAMKLIRELSCADRHRPRRQSACRLPCRAPSGPSVFPVWDEPVCREGHRGS